MTASQPQIQETQRISGKTNTEASTLGISHSNCRKSDTEIPQKGRNHTQAREGGCFSVETKTRLPRILFPGKSPFRSKGEINTSDKKI